LADIDQWRDIQIQLHSLTKADETYTFYHDETNNVRKLQLEAAGLNVAELKVFVLGGLVHDGPPHVLDIDRLRTAMRIQSSASELKLHHVARGGFLDVLHSAKLTTFLEWINESGLLIHYHELDPFYWSTVDVIDAILPNIENMGLMPYHGLLKADLAEVMRADLPQTLELLNRYGYPAISAGKHIEFLDEILAMLDGSDDTLPEFNACMLKGVLQAGKRLDALDFSEGATPNLLIDNFSHFYLNRLAVFRNSIHILDMEPCIQRRLFDEPLTSRGKPLTHYRFADSKAEVGIQLADVVVGVLGKLHTYLTQTSREDVEADRDSLTGTGRENLDLLRNLIATSNDENIAFLHHVASNRDIDKMDMLLQFHDGQYV
jgi:hypothetical protein